MHSKVLDRLFNWSGYLAGTFLVLIGILVVAQIVARLFNHQIPSIDEFAGYCLAATSFLGLAYSFRTGSHIRVTLFTDKLGPATQRWVLIMALLFAICMIGIWAYHSIALIHDSWIYNEMSTGLVKYPIWIPQISMGLGVVLLCVALLEDLFNVVMRRSPNFEKNKEQMVQE